MKLKKSVKTFRLCQYEKIAKKCPYCGCDGIYRRELRYKIYDGQRIQVWLCSCKRCGKRFFPVHGKHSPAFYEFISYLKDVLPDKDIRRYCRWIGKRIDPKKIKQTQPKNEVLRILSIKARPRSITMTYLKKPVWVKEGLRNGED